VITFGICIGTEDKFQQFAAPSVGRYGEEDSIVLESRENTSIFTAYNEMLDVVRDWEDLEALVLMHEDVELRDPSFCAAVRRLAGDPEIAVIGVVGARGVDRLAWWEARGVGRCAETRGLVDFGGGTCDADAVDGLMLVLTPWAVRNLRFDAASFSGFHAYDVDICLAARAAGKRVVVTEIDLFHHTKGGLGDAAAFHAADRTLRAKWFGGRADGSRLSLVGASGR